MSPFRLDADVQDVEAPKSSLDTTTAYFQQCLVSRALMKFIRSFNKRVRTKMLKVTTSPNPRHDKRRLSENS